MRQQTILITGATDGIGRRTAERLAELGHMTILHGRSAGKLDKIVTGFIRKGFKADLVIADLADLTSVQKMTDEIIRRFPTLDTIINNAGVYMNSKEKSAQGFEMSFAVNHLAHYFLVKNLLPELEKKVEARIINVSSIAHRSGRFYPELHQAPRFDPYQAYADSKLANILFTLALTERYQNSSIISYSLHPGVVSTKLLQEGFGMNGPDSLDTGSDTSVFLATSEDVSHYGGAYFVKSVPQKPAPAANREYAEALWGMSRYLTEKLMK